MNFVVSSPPHDKGRESIDDKIGDENNLMQRTPQDLADALRALGVLGADETGVAEQLVGGVSSDIWRVDCVKGPVCVKRALAKLKVAADWRAPVERNAFEAAWMRTVAAIEPDATPALLAEDRDAGLFVMAYLDPADHALWKSQLRDGIAEPATARAVAERLVHIHAATAGDAAIAERFATDYIFRPIRLEPYLLATARVHSDLADILESLAEVTGSTHLALVHGDVSPKNILIGPRGPVFIDAECAWYGDPAFDLAFCLNHLLLKCLWTPAAKDGFLACFRALAETYLAGVTWEAREAIERRVAHLLPGLFLARVDGKSPAEYITEEHDKDRVRRVARALLQAPVERIDAIATAWAEELTS